MSNIYCVCNRLPEVELRVFKITFIGNYWTIHMIYSKGLIALKVRNNVFKSLLNFIVLVEETSKDEGESVFLVKSNF